MKKESKRKSTAKKGRKSVKTKPASVVADTQGQISDGMVAKQPQVMDKAAVAQAMFLYGDDTWAQAYFDQNDLHFLEREVFG